jgi:NADH-quinone oxidoreductase subunit M
MLHAGVLKKFGLYGLLRLTIPLLPEGARHWVGLLLVLLLGNIIYVGLVTIAQKRLDWMLGYSSVMHMGYIFLGIASASVLGMTGAVVLMFAHGLSIALLFAIAGEVRKRTGTLLFAELGGLGKLMPFAGLAFGLGAFAAIGLPGFANFAGEIMIFFGAFKNGWEMERFHIFQIATVLALWGVVISAVYMLRAYRRTFMGALHERSKEAVDLRRGLRVPVALLVGALICYGVFPQSFVRMVTPAFRSHLSSNSHALGIYCCSHNTVSAKGAAVITQPWATPKDPRNNKTPALKAQLTESRFQRSYWYDRIPGAVPQAKSEAVPLALRTDSLGTGLVIPLP